MHYYVFNLFFDTKILLIIAITFYYSTNFNYILKNYLLHKLEQFNL